MFVRARRVGVQAASARCAAFLAFCADGDAVDCRAIWTVSGTLFGTAGYAVVEGTFAFPGSQLMQSLQSRPDLGLCG